MAQFHRQSLAGHVHVHVHLAGRVVGTVPRVSIQLTLVAKFSTPYFADFSLLCVAITTHFALWCSQYNNNCMVRRFLYF